MVLTGGGVLGAYQVGVLEALARGLSRGNGLQPFDPKLIVGTSVGAFNAVFLAAQGTVPFAEAVDRLKHVWLHRIADRGQGNGVFRYRLDPRDLLRHLGADPLTAISRLGEDLRIVSTELSNTLLDSCSFNQSLGKLLFNSLDISNFLTQEPLGETIRQSIDFTQLEGSPRRAAVTAATWPGSTLCCFDGRDPLWRHEGASLLAAATALPGIFPATSLGFQRLADFGPIHNTPISPAINAGANVVHLILPFAIDQAPRDLDRVGSLAELYRSLAGAWVHGLWMQMRDLLYLDHLRGLLEKHPHLLDRAHLKSFGLRLPTQGRVKIRSYSPRRPLNLGLWELLDFRYERIAYLIELGFRNARTQKFFNPEKVARQLRDVSLFEARQEMAPFYDPLPQSSQVGRPAMRRRPAHR